MIAPKVDCTHLALEIQKIESLCGAKEYWRTMHALNRAKNILGWEAAEKLGSKFPKLDEQGHLAIK